MNFNEVTYEVEYFSEKFEKYAAATELARLESKGCGDPNKFDHLAKDFHKEGFDESLESLAQWRLNAFRSKYEEELTALANERYENS